MRTGETQLIEIFLPVSDNEGKRFGASLLAEVREELTDHFGGVTSFSRAPAQGVTDAGGKSIYDDIIVIEVMAESLERDWWTTYRKSLELRFRQREVMIRATMI